jgi:predicted MPP superfamily phosphohydrolase
VSRLHLPPGLSLTAGAIALLYLSTTSAAIAIYTAFQWLSRRLSPPDVDPGRRRLLNCAGAALASVPFAVAAYGFVQRDDFQEREIDIPVPGLPRDLDGFRLLHLSDIHLSAFLTEEQFARVIDASNQLRPRLAVVTGDLISAYGDPLEACLRQISRLRAEAGIFGCMGNHERYAGVEDFTLEEGHKLGIRFLRRRAQRLRFGAAVVNLAGVDYEPLAHRPHYLQGAERMVVPGAFNILLSHNPDVFPAAAGKGYDLTLSGHTHGGQVSVEILDRSINPARFFTPYVYGLYREGPRATYVTRGIGTIGIPARIGAPPEISIVTLRKA